MEKCKWKWDELTDSYDTSCDNKFCFIEGKPKDNNFKYCPYCGGVLVAQEVIEEC